MFRSYHVTFAFILTVITGGAFSDDVADFRLCEHGWLVLDAGPIPLLISESGLPIDMLVDDRWFSQDTEKCTISVEHAHDAAGAMSAKYETDHGIVIENYAPFDALGETAWKRTLRYENTTAKMQDLLSAVMLVRPCPQDGMTPWNPRPLYMTRLAGNWLFAVAYRGTSDLYRYHMRDGAVGHEVEACWRLAPGATAHIGDQIIWARHVAENTPANEREWAALFRDEAQRFYTAIGLRVPEGMPEWARAMILYEYNAGGHIDSRFSDVGGFHRLARQTDYLAELGVTAVWLQAPHRHKSPPNPVEGGWNLYDPLDVETIEPFMGGAEALTELCAGLREAGIQVLGEVVPHGGHSVQAKALTEWWTYERDGSPRRNWGGCGMDHASPEWQAMLASVMANQARDFGFVGCRIDVADGSGPNWNSPRTHHASYSTLGGASELLEALRDGMAGHVPYPLLIPESFDQVEYFRLTPIGYGHDFWMFMHNELEPAASDPTAMTRLLRDYLEKERGALPRGALTLRTLNNHDTVCEAGRVHHRFGAGLARALHGVCLMIPGIPMLYQEQEIGDYYALRALHQARHAIPEFTATDDVDYFAVSFAPEVFACLRGCPERGLALGLVNLSGRDIEDMARIADWISVPDGTVVYDGVSGRHAVIRDNTFPWTLVAYETALFRIGRVPEPMSKPNAAITSISTETERPRLRLEEGRLFFTAGALDVAFLAGEDAWALGADDGEGRTYTCGALELRVTEYKDRLRCELLFGHAEQLDAWPSISVVGADKWLVSGKTAVLHDRVLRRHFPWPETVDYAWDKSMYWGPFPAHALYNRIAPTGRFWESVVEPLHPEAPGLIFQDTSGQRVVMHGLTTDVHNLLLRDNADRHPEEGAYGLRLEFRGHDPELASHVDARGLGLPFHVASTGPDMRAVYEAVFYVTVANGNPTPIEQALGDTPRLNGNRHGYRLTLEGDDARVARPLGIVLPTPGAATWSALPLPQGSFRVQFTMRHSEIAPDGSDLDDAYEIKVGGNITGYEWVERNIRQHANAYLGLVLTEPVILNGDAQFIAITTTKDWCMIGERFTLLPVE